MSAARGLSLSPNERGRQVGVTAASLDSLCSNPYPEGSNDYYSWSFGWSYGFASTSNPVDPTGSWGDSPFIEAKET